VGGADVGVADGSVAVPQADTRIAIVRKIRYADFIFIVSSSQLLLLLSFFLSKIGIRVDLYKRHPQ
jgi:hypothetical protein